MRAGAARDGRDLVGRLVPFLMLRRYEPGERVPSERDLAERFQVSRGQIREALAYLEALRIIERRAKSGIYMAGEPASVEALALYAQLGVQISAEEIHQSVEMRRIHEIAAIRMASERATPENLARLREILAEEEALVRDRQPIATCDRLFHSEIVKATQNGVFFRIINVFYTMTAQQRELYFRRPDRGRMSHAEHLEMLAAIERRDPAEAARLMEAHLQGVDSYWHGLIAQGDAAPAERPQRGDGAGRA